MHALPFSVLTENPDKLNDLALFETGGRIISSTAETNRPGGDQLAAISDRAGSIDADDCGESRWDEISV